MEKVEEESTVMLEPWVDFIIRATEEAKLRMEDAKVEDWVVTQRRRKWRWAGHAARRKDNRWTHRILDWRPEGGKRPRQRPLVRWADAIDKFMRKTLDLPQGDWILVAQDQEEWDNLEEDFAKRG